MFRRFKVQFFVLIFFVLDKAVLIPVIKYNFTEAELNNPYMETFDNLENASLVQSMSSDKKKLWCFGTSRSFPFYFLPVDKNTDSDRFLSTEQKFELKRWDAIAFSALGSNPAIYFTRLLQLLEKGILPDRIALEVSPFSFNKNNRYNKITQTEGIPFDLMIRNLDKFPTHYASEIFYSRFFALSRYKISQKAIHDRFLKKKREVDIDYFFQTIQRKEGKIDKLYSDAEFEDFDMEKITYSEKVPRFVKMVDLIDEYFYKNWKLDETQFAFIEEIIRFGKKKNIPVVLWRPRVYSEGGQNYKKYDIDKVFRDEIRKISEKHEIYFLDFNIPQNLKCGFYRDASHLSPRCYTELGYKLIEKL